MRSPSSGRPPKKSLSLDFLGRWDTTPFSPVGTAEYEADCGETSWRKKVPTKAMPKVRHASSMRRPEVFPGNTTREMVVKKNALRPKAANGKAVAVPR